VSAAVPAGTVCARSSMPVSATNDLRFAVVDARA
jgi:hypothetical protein